MKNLVKNTKALSKNMTYIILALIVLFAFSGGTVAIQQAIQDYTGEPTTIPPTGIAPSGEPLPEPEITYKSAVAKWSIRAALTQTDAAAGDTCYVGTLVADSNGVFDTLKKRESTEFDAAPDTSTRTYTTGDDIVIAVSSDDDAKTGATENHPRWFYIKDLSEGAAIRSFDIYNPISAISQTPGSSTFTVTESRLGDTVGTVKFVDDQTDYWDFGTFEVYEHAAKDYILAKITYAGATGSSVSNGATWIDTDAEITANFTLATHSEDLKFELNGETTNTAFGLPVLSVNEDGTIQQHNAVLIWGTDGTEVDPTDLTADGWQPINKAGLDEVAYYYVIDPRTDGGLPTMGDSFSISIPISLDTSALTASTEYEFEAWAIDWQLVSNVAIGATTTSLPSNNGFISDPGCDSVVLPLALTVSSNALATPQLMGHFTTAS